MGTTNNASMQPRYKILELKFRGTLDRIGAQHIYGDGQGFWQEAVIKVDGVAGDAYVPITLFNENIGESDIGKPISCSGTLSSRQFIDRNGDPRWGLSLSGFSVRVGQVEEEQKKAAKSQYQDQDEMPF